MALKQSSNNEKSGKISYSSGIVSGIVSLAVSEINGVAILSNGKKSFLKRVSKTDKREGIKIDYEGDGMYVDVSIKVYYGYSVPDIAFRIQENIKKSVESMTNFKIANVDVHVLGVIFDVENAIAD